MTKHGQVWLFSCNNQRESPVLMDAPAALILSKVEDHSIVLCDGESFPQREEIEAVERIGAVLCDLFFSIYDRPIIACYANVRPDGPRSFYFLPYYKNDAGADQDLAEFFHLLQQVSEELSGTGVVVSGTTRTVSAARLSEYPTLILTFLGCVALPEGKQYCVRAFPDDLDRLIQATDRARYGKKDEDPFYSFRLH